jgi:hypothetical protein
VDNYYYLSDEKIKQMDISEIFGGQIQLPVIACGDCIKVIDGRGAILYEIKLDSQVNCFSQQKEKTSRGCPLIIYGCKNGSIGALELTKDEAIILWENDCDHRSAVSLIKVDQLAKKDNIVLTRESGEIELFVYTEK